MDARNSSTDEELPADGELRRGKIKGNRAVKTLFEIGI